MLPRPLTPRQLRKLARRSREARDAEEADMSPEEFARRQKREPRYRAWLARQYLNQPYEFVLSRHGFVKGVTFVQAKGSWIDVAGVE